MATAPPMEGLRMGKAVLWHTQATFSGFHHLGRISEQ